MAKLKVLALSYLFPNATQPNHGIFVFNRLNALSKYVDIKVINPIPWSSLHSKLPQYANRVDIPRQERLGNLDIYHPRYFSIPKLFKSIESYTYYSAISSVLNGDLSDFDYDIVDLHWTFPDLPAGYILANKKNVRYMATLRGMEAFHKQDSGLRKNIVRHFLLRASAIVSLSDELKQVSIELGSLAEYNYVIRNGVDTNRFSYIERFAARERIGLSQSEKIIVAVGALIERKGFDIIIQSLPEVLARSGNETIKLYILGAEGPEGDFRRQLHQQVKTLGLQGAVIFQGAIANAELPYWYNAADIFCLASRGEGSPNVLTEALACGCPAVATDVGAVREIIESESNLGVCVAGGDSSALSVALARVLQTEYNRELNANIFSIYNWDWCAKNVYSVYKRLMVGENE